MENKNETKSLIIFDKYKIENIIGEGSFGKVYSGINIATKEKIALKLESIERGVNLLESEAYNLAYTKGDGIPKIICYGYNSKYNIMVMELLDKNLEELFQKCNKKFSVQTVCYLAVQIIERVRHIHKKNLIHRDLKPENFLIGRGQKNNQIYLIDFGLCFKYRSSSTNEHSRMRKDKSLTGTARYASLNAHLGYEQSRRDDLESVGYILVYFLKSSLPWQGLKLTKVEEKFKRIQKVKTETTLEELCEDIPREFFTYLQYCRNLSYEEDPNYEFLISLFHDIMDRENFIPDRIKFDWQKYNLEDSLSKISPDLDLTNNNKSAIILMNQSLLNNSVNYSQINQIIKDKHKKKPSMSAILKKQTRTISSKKVSFKNLEIYCDSPDGKKEKEVREIPEFILDYLDSPTENKEGTELPQNQKKSDVQQVKEVKELGNLINQGVKSPLQQKERKKKDNTNCICLVF